MRTPATSPKPPSTSPPSKGKKTREESERGKSGGSHGSKGRREEEKGRKLWRKEMGFETRAKGGVGGESANRERKGVKKLLGKNYFLC